MGRVSRYKKVKSIDPFAKNNTWTTDVGPQQRRNTKRKSKTAQRLKEQKLRQRKGRPGAGSNGLYDTGGYDLPPVGGDEFDLRDLVGSVKKQVGINNTTKGMDSLLEPIQGLASQMKSVAPSSSSLHVVNKGNDDDGEGKKTAKKNKKKKKQSKQPATTPNGELVITHKTPTNEIIAAHSNPKRKRANDTTTNNDDGDAGPSKQERRKAYLQEKKLKKRRKITNNNDDDDDEDVLAIHRQQQSSTNNQQPKKHMTQQQNYSDTIRARSLLDDQVERPPTFSVLPRGAHKLSKHSTKQKVSGGDEGEEQRIRKERQALERMRERVMRQYSVLREKRRGGGV